MNTKAARPRTTFNVWNTSYKELLHAIKKMAGNKLSYYAYVSKWFYKSKIYI